MRGLVLALAVAASLFVLGRWEGGQQRRGRCGHAFAAARAGNATHALPCPPHAGCWSISERYTRWCGCGEGASRRGDRLLPPLAHARPIVAPSPPPTPRSATN